MSQYTVAISRNAQKQLNKAPNNMRGRLQSSIDSLAHEPRPYGAIKLKGARERYRVREGDWRIIYSIDDKYLEVDVVKVADRKDAYDDE